MNSAGKNSLEIGEGRSKTPHLRSIANLQAGQHTTAFRGPDWRASDGSLAFPLARIVLLACLLPRAASDKDTEETSFSRGEHCRKFQQGEDPRTSGEQRHLCRFSACQHRLWAPERQQGRQKLFKMLHSKLLSRPPGCCCFLSQQRAPTQDRHRMRAPHRLDQVGETRWRCPVVCLRVAHGTIVMHMCMCFFICIHILHSTFSSPD